MPNTPAITTGMMFLITRCGCITPMDAIPMPAFAVPYAAPVSAQKKAGGVCPGKHVICFLPPRAKYTPADPFQAISHA